MPTTTIRRKELGDLLEDHLRDNLVAGPGTAAVTVYRGEVTGKPAVDPTSGRILPYVVLFDGVGTMGLEEDLADVSQDLRWSCYMVLGAGWLQECMALIDRVCALTYRWTPALPTGQVAGRMAPPPGYDPGPPRRLDTFSPPRWESPLQWRLDVTA